jgi:HrpA-like RNA helicase
LLTVDVRVTNNLTNGLFFGLLSLRVQVGMRMGHGVRDVAPKTKLFFVTTGYLVRLLAYRPESFDQHTHLIIDEVHERSVDGDVLCYLAKRLLSRHPTIRLVLMSATMHISLYQDYFYSQPSDPIYYGDLDCLSVGARRFPLEIFHADDLCRERSGLSSVFRPLCKKICEKRDLKMDAQFAKKQYTLAFNIILETVRPGTGVLVFVSGIQDITEINELFVGMNNPKYIVVHIHSDIPYEDQELAFKPVEADQVKVVLATNAAESSITLPDVDVVICLGSHKAIAYDPVGHHVMLTNQFISKASAAQRAGRTGRTRPGTVYRLYSSDLFYQFSDHDTPEILRMPLEDVILNLRAMLEESNDFEGVVPILEGLLEAPQTSNIDNSFRQLHKFSMITEPNDWGELTPLGRMSGNLPVDLHLSRMIAFGIALGVGAEAVAMAAALTVPKSPFRTAHNLIHTGKLTKPT